ncbi:MAG: hypothetical protein RIE58_12375 [Vicingaceae bacterium]
MAIMRVYRIIHFFLVYLITSGAILAQKGNVGIGTNTPHPSAILHLGDDQGKGFKIPYTDTSAVIAYANSYNPPIPIANGLLIYQKGAETFYYYDAPKNKWVPLSGITGPTGVTGITGPTGFPGPTGSSSQWRYGNGGPAFQAGDKCGDYYLDLENTYLYRYGCPSGPWQFKGGPYKSRIKEGETVHLSSKTRQIAIETAANTLVMDTINGLSYNVVAPPGYNAFAWITAYGSVKKVSVNNDYNYARFDIFFPGKVPADQKMWQSVAMGPNSSTPNNNDNVSWSISMAAELGPSQKIEIRGGQEMRTKTGLGNIIIADAPGTENEAHLDIMVFYVRIL